MFICVLLQIGWFRFEVGGCCLWVWCFAFALCFGMWFVCVCCFRFGWLGSGVSCGLAVDGSLGL